MVLNEIFVVVVAKTENEEKSRANVNKVGK